MTSQQIQPPELDEPAPFDIQVRVGAHDTRVTVTGELDLDTAPRLTDAVSTLRTGGGHVELDLSALGFCDVRGLAALLGAHHHVAGIDSHLTFTGASAALRRLVSAGRLTTVMDLR